jgi:ABC-type Mn2+/Zn2+ transport system ATPase subunit
LSGGEKAIALHLPLFAAAAAHYRAAPDAPRLILLDEVFVGVDDANRGQLLDLLVKFDLDMVLTSDHEWCTYRELDGIAIHQHHRRRRRGRDDRAVRLGWHRAAGGRPVRGGGPTAGAVGG